MAVLVSRVVLAAVFALAASAKLRDRAGSERSIAELGVPVRWAAIVAVLLPVLELVTAGGLLVGRMGAVLALVLLAAFSAVIVRNLAAGRRPSCHCFGSLSTQPIGWPSIARNALTATLAAFVLVDSQPMWPFAVAAALSAAAWLVPGMRRRWSERAGRPAAPFSLAAVDGGVATLDRLRSRGRPVVLLFSSPRCGACEPLMPQIARWQARLTVAVVSGGAAADTRAKAQEHGLADVLIDEDQTLATASGVAATPTALLIDSEGRVAATALGPDEIERLVAGLLAPDAPATRRVALGRFATAAGVVLFAPLLEGVAAAAPKRRRRVKVGDAWLCDQRYALCTAAACKPSPTDAKVAICTCLVLDGYSLGYKTCAKRAPSGRHVVSTFSTEDVRSRKLQAMTCPASAPWANCLDLPCTVDPDNPKRATCPCTIVEKGPSFTFGGGCEESNCTDYIMSGAAPPGVPWTKAMKLVGEKPNFPKSCPKAP